MFYASVAIVVIVAGIVRLLLPDEAPKKGVYRQYGKWSSLKYGVFYLIFQLRQLQNRRSKRVSGTDAGYGMRSRSGVEEMEKAQPLSKDHPMAVDPVYFNGADLKGCYFVAAMARRHRKLIQGLLYIRIPELGLLQLPSLPDTCLYEEEAMAYLTPGFKIQPIKPMKKWKISYSGKMRLTRPSSQQDEWAQVSFDVHWTATTAYFDFDTDLHVGAMCDAMCREPWSRDFFNRLRMAHQTHYEQFGRISGTVTVDDKPYDIRVNGVRDHSYGNVRDWKHLHRYCIQYLCLEDGTCICAGLVCMPLTLSRLPIGYVYRPDGSLQALQSIDMEFFDGDSGDDGEPPEHFHFEFVAGGTTYEVSGKVLQAPVFYMGYEWEARIHERMVTCTVNGVAGCGISEWNYRNHTGRPAIYNKKDIAKKLE